MTKREMMTEPPHEGDPVIILVGGILTFLLAVEVLMFLTRPPGVFFFVLAIGVIMAILAVYGRYRMWEPKTSIAYRRQVKAYHEGIRSYCPVCGAEFGRVGLDAHIVRYHPALYGRLMYSSVATGLAVGATSTVLLLALFLRFGTTTNKTLIPIAYLVLIFLSFILGTVAAVAFYRRGERSMRSEWGEHQS